MMYLRNKMLSNCNKIVYYGVFWIIEYKNNIET